LESGRRDEKRSGPGLREILLNGGGNGEDVLHNAENRDDGHDSNGEFEDVFDHVMGGLITAPPIGTFSESRKSVPHSFIYPALLHLIPLYLQTFRAFPVKHVEQLKPA
jgi:hypothetical protein